MHTLLIVLYYLTEVFWALLLARIVVEMIASFSRGWSPRGIMAVIFEWLFAITDPPVKALRRVIPPVRMGGIALDLSVLVLFLLIIVVQMILGALMVRV